MVFISQAAKPSSMKLGLAGLLDGLGPELAAGTAAVAAAMSMPGISQCVPVAYADAATLAPPATSKFSFKFSGRGAEETNGPKPFISLADPYAVAFVFAKNLSIHLLIQFNTYMAALNDYEYQRMVAEEQNTLPPAPPPQPKWDATLGTGTFFALRELAVRAVRLTYEHLLYWRLGASRSEPFLRNGQSWVVNVLQHRHAAAGVGKQVFSYTFAMLHASALQYAAEATVAITLHVRDALRDPHKRRRDKAVLVAKVTIFQLGRCTLLLIATSGAAAAGTLLKPGLGTKVLPIAMEHVVNVSLQPVARAFLQ